MMRDPHPHDGALSETAHTDAPGSGSTAAPTTVPDTTIELVARLFAEEHVLLHWSQTSHHPRLAAAYRSLHGHATDRCRSVRGACSGLGEEARRRLLDRTLEAHEEAQAIAFELSRLKWLLARRRERLAHEALPGYAESQVAEEREATLLEGLLHELGRGMC